MVTEITDKDKYIVPVGYVHAIDHFIRQFEMDGACGHISYPTLSFRLGVMLSTLKSMENQIKLYKETKNEN